MTNGFSMEVIIHSLELELLVLSPVGTLCDRWIGSLHETNPHSRTARRSTDQKSTDDFLEPLVYISR